MTKIIKKARRKGGSSGAKGRRRGRAAAGSRGDRIGKNLVVVESPAKARTINRYLGGDYVVRASMGHVRDLPRKQMGVDAENGFAPTYEPVPGRTKVLTELRKYAKAAPLVYLATDLDREGEAIAWHVCQVLRLNESRTHRVVFNEITAGAIRAAFAQPRAIDMNKVNAQQARRILDRIVGYEVSPLLWKKVARGLSAGRVQTVAVRLIVDREREIDAFTPVEYWRVGTVFTPDLPAAAALAADWRRFLARRDEKDNAPTKQAQQEFLAERGAFRAELVRWNGRKFQADNAEAAIEVAEALGLAVREVRRREEPNGKGPAGHHVQVLGQPGQRCPKFLVSELKQRDSRTRPPAPFTTASLQQAAAVRLRFSASRTMRTAQQLYEGIEVPGEGSVGLITYMRTDSRHLSGDSLEQVRALIGGRFGEEYVPDKPNVYASAERAQQAHEAVRPTDPARLPADVKAPLTRDQFALYELIWKQFVACQMPPAVWKVTEADITAETPAGQAVFKAMGRRLAFDGFLRVAGMPRSGEQVLPSLEPGKPVAPVELSPRQHFTQAPPRYTEASLIKALEADNIGRPSTYAAIIQTIQDRQYVLLEERTFHATDLGIVVTDKLVKHFPGIFDVRFTAQMEDRLDGIEEARLDWVRVLEDFYGPFHAKLERAAEEMVHAKAETQPSDYACQACGKPMVYRLSRNGRYLACTGYPACKQTHPVDRDGNKIEDVRVDIACPKCGQVMLLRRGRFGPFLSCSAYPDCDGVVNVDKKGFVKLPGAPPLHVDVPCPKCGQPLSLRRGKRGPWLSCSAFPKCRGRAGWTTLDQAKREQLEQALADHERENPVPAIRHLDGTPATAETLPQPVDEPARE